MKEELSRQLSQAQARLESLITHDASDYEIAEAEKEVRRISRAVTRHHEPKKKNGSRRDNRRYSEDW